VVSKYQLLYASILEVIEQPHFDTMASNATQCYEIDNTFSYYAQDCRDGFDFTLLFEQTILTALPLGLLVLVAPARIWYLSKKSKKTTTSLLLPLKVVCY